eukprot:5128588-Alexandrium_andersonii.AAC.1
MLWRRGCRPASACRSARMAASGSGTAPGRGGAASKTIPARAAAQVAARSNLSQKSGGYSASSEVEAKKPDLSRLTTDHGL